MSDLLKEALLDIQQVKEVAEKNARNYVLETFVPKIQEYIEAQLLNESSEDNKELNQSNHLNCEKKQLLKGGDSEETEADEASSLDDNDDTDTPTEEELTLNLKDLELEDEDDVGIETENSSGEDDFDLELYDENDFSSENEEKSEEYEDDVYLNNESNFGGQIGMYELNRLLEVEADDEALDEADEADDEVLDEVGDVDMTDELEGMENMDTSEWDNEGLAGEGECPVCQCEPCECPVEEAFEAGDECPVCQCEPCECPVEEASGSDDEYVEIDEAELAEALQLMSESDPNQPFTKKAQKPDLDGDVLALREALRVVKRKLNEAENALSKTNKQLSESNLFNAKLLYANKLLNNRDLSKKDKVKIVEALDNAKSLREVKLLYSTFVAVQQKQLMEGTSRTLPGGSSRATSRGSASTQLNESASVPERWQKLAGITK